MSDAMSTPQRRGVVAVIVREGHFLMIKRSAHVAAPGKICFPGGGIETGETEHEALVRELREELDVSIKPICKLWESVTPWNVALSWWHAILDHSERIQPNPAEVASVEWVHGAKMKEIPELLTSNHAFIDAMEAGVFVIE